MDLKFKTQQLTARVGRVCKFINKQNRAYKLRSTKHCILSGGQLFTFTLQGFSAFVHQFAKLES